MTDELQNKIAELEEIIKLYKEQVIGYDLVCSQQRIDLYELQIEVLKGLCGRQDEYGSGH